MFKGSRVDIVAIRHCPIVAMSLRAETPPFCPARSASEHAWVTTRVTHRQVTKLIWWQALEHRRYRAANLLGLANRSDESAALSGLEVVVAVRTEPRMRSSRSRPCVRKLHPIALQTNFRLGKTWCRRRDLNPRPPAYEADALPLSYAGPLRCGKALLIAPPNPTFQGAAAPDQKKNSRFQPGEVEVESGTGSRS